MRRFLSLPLFVLLAAGCNAPAPPDEPAARANPDVPPTAEALALATNSRGFAIDLYAQVAAAESGNVCVSPFSAHTALAMTAAGARGNTLEEMRRVLRLAPVDVDVGDTGYRNLVESLTTGKTGGGSEIRTANAVWAQTDFHWRPEFQQRVSLDFGAGLFEANFRHRPDDERRRINAWVEQQTQGKVKDLIADGRITVDHRMVLANAVYFKGLWADRFDPARTRSAPFTRADGTKAEVPLMHREGGFRMSGRVRIGDDPADAEVSLAEIPYRGGLASMVVLLPAKPDGLPALERRLTPELLHKWRAEAALQERADLYLPRFKVEAGFDLKRPLRALGMNLVFDRDRADLSGMHTGRERLYADFVAHKAVIDVNEEGTEAAAGTAVGVKLKSAPPQFVADHPFLFLIRHVPTDTILFIGRYVGP